MIVQQWSLTVRYCKACRLVDEEAKRKAIDRHTELVKEFNAHWDSFMIATFQLFLGFALKLQDLSIRSKKNSSWTLKSNTK